MTRSIFWRLVWKEYRLQRALWIAMAVLTTLLMGLVFVAFSPRDKPQMLFWLASGLPAFYCLGCGAMLFAGEHENETYEFQRGLPVGAGRVFAAKIAFALTSVVLMFVPLWLLAMHLSGWTLHPTQGFSPLAVLLMLSLFGMQLFLWATLFSLLTKHVLIAAILGVAATSVSVQILAEWVKPGFSMDRYALAMPYCAVLASLLALVDCWLGVGWFRPRRLSATRSDLPTVASTSAAASSDRFRRPDRGAMFCRLVWQHGRQSVAMILAVLAVILISVTVATVGYWKWPRYQSISNPISFYFGIVPSLAAIPLLGLSAFLADQSRQGYRFLTDRGVPPKYIWLSRQFVLLLPVALVLPLLLSLAFLLAPSNASRDFISNASNIVVAMGYVLGYVVIGATVGQLCSMFFSSGILAGVFGIVLTVLLAGWGWLMLFWQVDWLWSVLPIPLALLLASRLRTPNWLLQRNTLRAWLLPALVLAVPTVVILTAVPLYRIYQIPVVGPRFSTAEYPGPMTAEEKATRDLYLRAAQVYRPVETYGIKYWEEEPYDDRTKLMAWIGANQKAMELALLASRGPLVHPIDDVPNLSGLQVLLMKSAAKLEEEGKLDAALAQYLASIRISIQFHRCNLSDRYSFNRYQHELQTYAGLASWAARPHQTPARIVAALRQFEEATKHASVVDPIKLEYVRLRTILEGGPWPSGPLALWLSLPWERERALRLLNFQVFRDLEGKPSDELGMSLDWRALKARLDRQKNSELLYTLSRYIDLTPISYAWEETDNSLFWVRTLQEEFQAAETVRRATRLILALEAWKVQHGSLPKSLDQLVGPYLDRLPVDPYSGVPFHYLRGGLGIPLTWQQPVWPLLLSGFGGKIPANTPFIWSTGTKIVWREDPTEPDIHRHCYIYTDWAIESGARRRSEPYRADWVRFPDSQYDMWEAGWPFVIP
jgi:hypothetical protein